MGLLHDHRFIHRQVTDLHDHLEQFEGDQKVEGSHHRFEPGEVAGVRRALKAGLKNDANHPQDQYYYARDPLISLLQSAMHKDLVNRFGREAVEHDKIAEGDAFTTGDLLGWGVKVGLSLIWKLLHGSHKFVDAPATFSLSGDVRLVLLADWGTGRPEARHLAKKAATFVTDSERPVHVVHLGDTYYSGTKEEAQAHLLEPWPVTMRQAAEGVHSWALNGNHDMYSGGEGLFETTLGDPRFAQQKADGAATSWFHLQSDTWDIVGLDTAYRNPLLDIRHGDFLAFGRIGYLHGSQAAYLKEHCGKDGRKLLLLSHHQLFSAYDEDATNDSALRPALKDTLERGVDAWFWGHEHDCLAYGPLEGVNAARVIGHGAVPMLLRTDPPGTPIDGRPDSVVKPGNSEKYPPEPALDAVEWEFRGMVIGDDGVKWGQHGFAVVDVVGDTLQVSHVNDQGSVYLTETIPRSASA
jgi:hypothetical protein